MSDVDNGGGCACVGTEGIWEISEPLSRFCCKIYIALKNVFKQIK